MQTKHVVLGILAAFIWGAAFVVSEAALKTTPPLFFAAMRFLAAACFIVVIPRPKVPWKLLVAAGFLLGACQYGLLFIGMVHGVAPGIASLIIQTQVFFTIAFAAGLFGERVTRNQMIGIGSAAVGLALLGIDRAGGRLDTFGLFLVVLAALSGGAGNIILKRIGSTDRVGIAVWMSLVPPIPLFIASAILEQNLYVSCINLNLIAVLAILYTSVLSTVAAFAIWALLFSTYPASSVGSIQLLVPLFSIILAIPLDGEVFTDLKIISVIMIFAGLILISPLSKYILRDTPRVKIKTT